MTPDRRATDRVPDYTPPWWVSLALLVLMFGPVAVSVWIGCGR